jgi:benzoate-CoA ligase family protein
MNPKRSIVDYVAEHARQRPDGVALVHRDRQITYGQLEQATARCRGALAALGVKGGDRVALVMSDSPEMVTAILGVMGLGAIVVPCSTMVPPEGLAYVFRDCGATLVIAGAEHRANAGAAGAPRLVGAPDEFNGLLAKAAPAPLGDFDAGTPCLILYTSGSTGQPKGAVHRHGHMPWTVEAVAKGIHRLTPEDRLFSVPRLFFAYGLGNSLSVPLGSGACVVLVSERPTAALIAETLARYRPTVFFGVPTVFRMLLEHARQGNRVDAGSVKFSVSAGEVLPLATWTEWKALTGHEIVETIGTTELLYAFIHNRLDHNRPGSSGLPVEGYEIELKDEKGVRVQGAGRGALHVRGGTATPYYWNKPEQTAETIRDGWVRTGDVYRRDEDGFYWFEGRADDLFKCSGLWVSPAEVEEAVARHPAVLEAAVIAESDTKGATIPAAYVLLRQGSAAGETLAAEILARAAENLPRFKRPQRVHFVQELPRTATGKVQRCKLRQLARGG